MCCKKPNTKHLEVQAQSQADIGRQQMDLTRQQMDRDAAFQAEYLALQKQNAAGDAELREMQIRLANDQEARRKEVFEPLEDEVIQEALDYDSEGRVADEMARADNEVVQAYGKQLAASDRDLARMGARPGSARQLALRENAAIDAAKASADAATAAGRDVKRRGWGMRMDAAALGRGMAGMQTSAVSSAAQIGSNSLDGFARAGDMSSRGFRDAMSGFDASGQSGARAGSLYGQAAQMRADHRNGMVGGLTKLVGFGIGKWG